MLTFVTGFVHEVVHKVVLVVVGVVRHVFHANEQMIQHFSYLVNNYKNTFVDNYQIQDLTGKDSQQIATSQVILQSK